MLILSGCALTTTESSRQLESGEVVVSGAVDLPGLVIIPKVTGQATLGFGVGDGSLRIGTAGIYNHIGGGVRFYPTNWLNLSLQGDFAGSRVDPGYDDEWTQWITFTPRISTSTTPERSFYGGVQSNFFIVYPLDYAQEFGGLIGLLGGYHRDLKKPGLSLQFEIIIDPIYYYEDFDGWVIESPLYDFGVPIINAEMSLALFWRPAEARDAPESIEPTSVSDADEEAGKVESEGLSRDERAAVQRYIRSQRSDIRECYEIQLLEDRDLSGRIVVSFEIATDGAVREPSISDSTVGSTPMEECILEVIDTWTLPAPEQGESVEVRYPFTFSTSSTRQVLPPPLY